MVGDGALRLRRSAEATSVQIERTESRKLVIFSLFGVLMGLIGGVAAWALYHLIMIFTGLAFFRQFMLRVPLYPPTHGLGAGAVIIPVIGGLLVGVMAKYGTDRIRGHGIPEAMEAVLKYKGRVSPRIAIFKPISAAIAVGTGGPFGAEGPIIQTAGAIGSLIGQTMRLTSSERRILLACGGAAGMAGIFNTPIAAVALALELLLFEFRPRSLVPVILASGVATALRGVLLGSARMFNVGPVGALGGPLDLLWFLPLGIIIGICAVLISKSLFFVEEFFDELHIDLIFKPALGALVLGGVAVFQPLVLGMGYTTITEILQNHFTSTTLIGIAVGKSVALVASLGSGTSGGLLAPMLMIGASIGSGYGRGIHALFPAAGINPGICGIVAMSSLFSAAARAPLTSFVFAFELTGDYQAIIPLMIGCMIADVVARSLSTESVMTARLTKRGLRVQQDFAPNLLRSTPVQVAMSKTVNALAEHMPLRSALRALLGEPVALSLMTAYDLGGTASVIATATDATPANGHQHTADASLLNGRSIPTSVLDAPPPGNNLGASDVGTIAASNLYHRWSFPVVNAERKLTGVVTRGELLTAVARLEQLDRPVSDIATHEVTVAYPDEMLDVALRRMLGGDYAMLPVVSRDDGVTLLGILSRGDILRVRLLEQADEEQRERMLALPFTHRRAGNALASAELASFDLRATGPAPDEEHRDQHSDDRVP